MKLKTGDYSGWLKHSQPPISTLFRDNYQMF
ncbi:hypothetical protein SPHINGOR109_50810 [Sphingorhabdus sp. 109]|nr:hypothetical protein SPHINGOR109_50810 [Sphingorhabdus sp. 109]